MHCVFLLTFNSKKYCTQYPYVYVWLLVCLIQLQLFELCFLISTYYYETPSQQQQQQTTTHTTLQIPPPRRHDFCNSSSKFSTTLEKIWFCLSQSKHIALICSKSSQSYKSANLQKSSKYVNITTLLYVCVLPCKFNTVHIMLICIRHKIDHIYANIL